MTSTMDLHVSPLGRVEGDLDVRVTLTDGVVTDAWTTAGMFRGFEMILKGKDPQAGLIVTPRICGICGGSHLYKAVYALDTAWQTHVPPNGTRIRNIAQACETLQSIPRWFYAIFAIDLTNKRYAKTPSYDEAVRRFAPFVGTAYEKGVTLSNKPVEIYAIFGGQWPHSSFMIPGGVMSAPTLSDVTRSIAILDYWKHEWLEKEWLGCSDRALDGEQYLGGRPGLGGRERVPAQLRLRVLHPLRPRDRPRLLRRGLGQLPVHRHLLRPGAVHPSHHRGPQRCPDLARQRVRRWRVLGLRPGPGHRGSHPLVLPWHRVASPLRGRDRPDRSTRRAQAGQVLLGQVPALRRSGARVRAARGRSAGPSGGRR